MSRTRCVQGMEEKCARLIVGSGAQPPSAVSGVSVAAATSNRRPPARPTLLGIRQILRAGCIPRSGFGLVSVLGMRGKLCAGLVTNPEFTRPWRAPRRQAPWGRRHTECACYFGAFPRRIPFRVRPCFPW